MIIKNIITFNPKIRLVPVEYKSLEGDTCREDLRDFTRFPTLHMTREVLISEMDSSIQFRDSTTQLCGPVSRRRTLD